MAEPIDRNTLREQLAALCHEQWSGWMKYQFDRMIFAADADSIPRLMTADDFYRWRLQARTPYVDLTESEKESDRKEADRFLAILTPAPQPSATDGPEAFSRTTHDTGMTTEDLRNDPR